MKVTFIAIIIRAPGTVPKGLTKGLVDLEIKRRVETSKLLHYCDRPEYWEESWRFVETCCHSNSSERPSTDAGMKNSQRRELKKLWNMKVTLIPLVIGALGTVTKGLIKWLEEKTGQVETIQSTALFRSVRIQRKVLETCGDLLSLKL